MKKPIDRIKSFLDRRNAEVMDFSDHFETPVVPYWTREGQSLYLNSIKIRDGNPVLIWGTDFWYDFREVETDALEVPQDILKEVADFLNYRRHHLDRHAIITKKS